jgi:phosphohistidine phosphatase
MLRLLLIRHAKSSWDIPGQPDHERKLNARGRRDAPRMGAWLRAEGLRPDLALVSSSARTRETWAALAPLLGDPPAEFRRDLYEAEPDALLRAIRAAPDAATLALVGHNPGIGETARRLLDHAPDDAPGFEKYPTAAIAVIDFDAGSWREIGWGGGRLAAFVTPKLLAH